MKMRKNKKKMLASTQILILISFSFAISFILNASLTGAIPSNAPTGGGAKITNVFSHAAKGEVLGKKATSFIFEGDTYMYDSRAGGYITDSFEVSGENPLNEVPKEATSVNYEFATKGLTGAGNALIQGLFWASVLSLGVKMLGGLFGLKKETESALIKSIYAGGLTFAGTKWAINQFAGGKTTLGFLNKPLSAGQVGFGAAVIVSVIVFLALYKKEKVKVVSFQCLPWEPQLGGQRCDECNKDPFRPCSEYRCKSLGQACELVNKGTDKEQCIWKSKFDVNSPKITPWNEPLNSGLSYVPMLTRPTALGTRIVKGTNGCLDAFTPLQFGIMTDEPAQCKLDYVTKNYSELQFYFGGSNYYEKNHTQKMKLPSPVDENGNIAPLFKNDGTFQLWVQCQDANGNKNDDGNRNEDFYVIEFCVDKSPDTTEPVIEKFSIESGSAVQYKVDNLSIDAFVNEPATCKWSRQDKSYDSMENTMNCADSVEQINADLAYTCSGKLTGIEDRKNNDFYFRCRDNAGNTNVQSKKLVLRGSQSLNIIDIKPNGTITGSTSTIPVQIELTTDDGADEGKATCYYNSSLTTGFSEMFETNNYVHKQVQDLITGNYNYQFRCIDAGGNLAEANATFSVFVDKNSPEVTRTYRDNALKIVTNEDADCSYSLQNCNFELAKGINMEYMNINVRNQLFAPWTNGATYYIKCTDKYGNQPLPNECSVVVSPRGLTNSTG